MAGFRNYIFDVDGVSVHTERMKLEAWNEAVNKDGASLVAITDDEYRTMVGCKWEDYGHLLSSKSQQGGYSPEESTKAAIEGRYDAIYAEMRKGGIPPIERNVDFIKGLLDRKAAGEPIKLALASSDEHDLIQGNIFAAGMNIDGFDVVVSGADDLKPGCNKPKPDIYLLAAEQLGINPLSAMVLEDTRAGAEAAVKAGIGLVVPVPHELTVHQDFGMLETLFSPGQNLIRVNPEAETSTLVELAKLGPEANTYQALTGLNIQTNLSLRSDHGTPPPRM